jgi:hypothetical protein
MTVIFKDKAGLSFRHPFSVLKLKMMRSGLMHTRNQSQAVVFAPCQRWKREKGGQ